MQLQVKAQHGTVPDAVRSYAEKRLSKLSRRLYEGTIVEVTFSRERNPSIREDHVAEGVVFTKGPNLVARERATTYEAAIDQLVDKLERQARRYRDKRRRGPGRNSHPLVEGTPVIPDEESPLIVKTKQFPVKPMSPEEAVLQLELVGHDFFVFQNAETLEVNVVYRRRDGNYGLIEPQLS